MWVVSLPTGLAGHTIWPDREWIEAKDELPEDVSAR
jgi:hypothetical protein